MTHTNADDKESVIVKWLAPPAGSGSLKFRYVSHFIRVGYSETYIFETHHLVFIWEVVHYSEVLKYPLSYASTEEPSNISTPSVIMLLMIMRHHQGDFFENTSEVVWLSFWAIITAVG